MSKKRIAFLINPKSGGDRKTDRVALVKSLLSPEYESELLIWDKIEKRDELFDRVRNGGFDVAVAVGGDGTVSQLAEALCGGKTALGILPFGSGNGLARHLGVPMKTKEAMRLLEHGKVVQIDRGRINQYSFFCTAGVGFDAQIGKLFAESETRGFMTYASMTIRELRSYKPEKYTITIDGKEIEREAFILAVGNAAQYGNNAWIAPQANVMDGKLHLTILKPFRWYQAPGIARHLFARTLHKSTSAEIFEGKEFSIRRTHAGAAHYDGEPANLDTELRISIDPAVLPVLVPERFSG
ncbi:MAG: diacylglycerol/lipid kinase family protein [Bacteroidia bacterium]